MASNDLEHRFFRGFWSQAAGWFTGYATMFVSFLLIGAVGRHFGKTEFGLLSGAIVIALGLAVGIAVARKVSTMIDQRHLND